MDALTVFCEIVYVITEVLREVKVLRRLNFLMVIKDLHKRNYLIFYILTL